MSITTTVEVTTTLNDSRLPTDVELRNTPVDWIDTVITHDTETGTYTVDYALHDDDPYWGYSEYILGEGVEFEEFRTEWERDEYIEATDRETHVAFIVDHFEHSTHAYSLHQTVTYPYGGWDTRPSCVLRVPLDFQDPEEAAQAILKAYTDYVNGDVYYVVRETFDATGKSIDYDDVSGFIGIEQTEEALKNVNDYL